MVTADHYNPDWGCLDDFLQYRVQKLLAWLGIWDGEPATLDLSSQPGAFDLSGTANPALKKFQAPNNVVLTSIFDWKFDKLEIMWHIIWPKYFLNEIF